MSKNQAYFYPARTCNFAVKDTGAIKSNNSETQSYGSTGDDLEQKIESRHSRYPYHF